MTEQGQNHLPRDEFCPGWVSFKDVQPTPHRTHAHQDPYECSPRIKLTAKLLKILDVLLTIILKLDLIVLTAKC